MLMKLVHDDVTLRPLIESDIQTLWEITSTDTFLHMLNQIQTIEEFRGWMTSGIEQMHSSNATLVFVVLNTQTLDIMGSTRIYLMDYLNKTCEIGATFYGSQFQRTHVNTTAKLLLLTYAFETLGMIRVQFKTDVKNVQSQRAIERLGAIKEGVLRNERIRSTGVPRHAIIYSIIQSEWQKINIELKSKLNNYSV